MSNLSDVKESSARGLVDTDRVLGLAVTIGGLASTYYFIIRQALAAMRHEPGVFLSVKGVMGSPVVIGVGVVYAVFGSRCTKALGDNNARPSRTACILILLFCAADFYLYSWLRNFIESYGYVFHIEPPKN